MNFSTNLPDETQISEEEKRELKPAIITQNDLNAFEQENILEARRWIMSKNILKKRDLFSKDFIKELHKNMFKHVWKWAGDFRTTNKNIGVEFFQIETELFKLLKDANYWHEQKTYNINELAIIFHHRLVKIHLFPNGNGRHARLIADAIIKKYEGKKLSWGGRIGDNELRKADETRKAYILALKEADLGSYKGLIAFAQLSRAR